MQEDLHFYGIYSLARAAGFPAGKGHILAYSSQYVDDSTSIDYPGLRFKPVRSAHLGLETFSKDIQKTIYLPFHFLPCVSGTGDLRLVTRPASLTAENLLKAAFDTEGQADWLYRIGIALHAYTDTWSHQGFTGLKSGLNAVDDLNAFEKSRYWTMAQIRWIQDRYPVYKFAPRIGHAEALSYPDIPYLHWSYSDASSAVMSIKNPDRYIEALEAIYAHLAQHAGVITTKPWKKLRPPLLRLLKTRGNLNERVRVWKRSITNGALFDYETKERSWAHYNEDRWRKDAIEPVFERRNRRKFKRKEGFTSSHWARWHQAAKDHLNAFKAIGI